MRSFYWSLSLFCGGVTATITPVVAESVPGWPDGIESITYVSQADDTEQPALFWKPSDQDQGTPLLVALHTWSSGYTQQGSQPAYARWCQEVGWTLIHPHFRGRNRTPEAMGSELVVADIISAVDYAKANANIDATRIYLMGGSGGGHASLLMAGRAPDIWAGVSAWCPITDIAAWHEQCRGDDRFRRYADEIESALGGPPTTDSTRLADAKQRSPLTHLEAARTVPLDINHGVNDGRSGSVPFTHSLNAWNVLVSGRMKLSDEMIERFYDTQLAPKPYSEVDEFYGERQPLFRVSSASARLTVFNGGHEIIHNAGLNWLASQRKGEPAVWDVPVTLDFQNSAAETASGK